MKGDKVCRGHGILSVVLLWNPALLPSTQKFLKSRAGCLAYGLCFFPLRCSWGREIAEMSRSGNGPVTAAVSRVACFSGFGGQLPIPGPAYHAIGNCIQYFCRLSICIFGCTLRAYSCLHCAVCYVQN